MGATRLLLLSWAQSAYQDRPVVYGSLHGHDHNIRWENQEEYRGNAYEHTQNYAGYDAPRAYLEAEHEHRYPQNEE